MSLSPREPHAHQRYIFEWLPAIIEAGRRGPLKLIDTFMREKLLFRKFIRFKSRAGKSREKMLPALAKRKREWNLKFMTLYAAQFDLHIFPNQYLIRVIYTKRFRPESSYRAIINFKFDIENTSDFQTIVFA